MQDVFAGASRHRLVNLLRAIDFRLRVIALRPLDIRDGFRSRGAPAVFAKRGEVLGRVRVAALIRARERLLGLG